jgi:hypothetical protein
MNVDAGVSFLDANAQLCFWTMAAENNEVHLLFVQSEKCSSYHITEEKW